jgi:hypothetical protein
MKCAINLMGFQRFDSGTKSNKNISWKKCIFALAKGAYVHRVLRCEKAGRIDFRRERK